MNDIKLNRQQTDSAWGGLAKARLGDKNRKIKSEAEILAQLVMAYRELNRIEHEVTIGHYNWRIQRRYIDALEWVLGVE